MKGRELVCASSWFFNGMIGRWNTKVQELPTERIWGRGRADLKQANVGPAAASRLLRVCTCAEDPASARPVQQTSSASQPTVWGYLPL